MLTTGGREKMTILKHKAWLENEGRIGTRTLTSSISGFLLVSTQTPHYSGNLGTLGDNRGNVDVFFNLIL